MADQEIPSGTEVITAKDILARREEVITSMADDFREATGEIAHLMTEALQKNAKVSEQISAIEPPESPVPVVTILSELPPGATRKIYKLLTDKHLELLCLWGLKSYELEDNKAEINQILVGWVGNRFKRQEEKDGVVRVVPAERMIVGTEKYPYMMHPTVELPLIMEWLFTDVSQLQRQYAIIHDTLEEGEKMGDNKPDAFAKVPVDDIIQKFSSKPGDPKLARSLALAAQALVETEFKIIRDDVDTKTYKDQKTVGDLIKEATTAFPGEEKKEAIEKVIVQDPLEFGGLALQLGTVIEKLSQHTEGLGEYTYDELMEICSALIKTEMADRVSDIANLGRFFHKYPHTEDNDFVKFRMMHYTARIQNMADTLRAAAKQIGKEEEFKSSFNKFDSIIEEVLDSVSSKRRVQITKDKQDAFYRYTFSPLQSVANEAMRQFIDTKVTGIVNDLAFSEKD